MTHPTPHEDARTMVEKWEKFQHGMEDMGSMARCHLKHEIAKAITEARDKALEEAAKVAGAFVHTRRDCEEGTTSEEIAEQIRALKSCKLVTTEPTGCGKNVTEGK